jgi:hypothetical protein
MDKAIQKSKAIEKAVLAYNNDPSLSYRRAAVIYNMAPNSVINRYSKKTISTPDIFITNQKFSPVEEAVLIEYSVEYYNQDFLLRISNLRNFANELLKNRGLDKKVGVN